MVTIGQQLDSDPEAKTLMDTYFQRIASLAKNTALESRLRFMLQVCVVGM